jgi:hypothetical protein
LIHPAYGLLGLALSFAIILLSKVETPLPYEKQEQLANINSKIVPYGEQYRGYFSLGRASPVFI